MLKREGFTNFFFNGNQTPSEVLSEIKHNFISFMKSRNVPSFYCHDRQSNTNICRADKVHVYQV